MTTAFPDCPVCRNRKDIVCRPGFCSIAAHGYPSDGGTVCHLCWVHLNRPATQRFTLRSCPTCPGNVRQKVMLDAPKPVHSIRVLLPDHYNCSICEYRGQTLLASRLGWHGRVFLSELNADYQPKRTWQLDLAHPEAMTGVEDPRLFLFRDRLHVAFTGYKKAPVERTSQLYARLTDDLTVEEVFFPQYANRRAWEKNHSYFEWRGMLHSVYSISPHLILRHEGNTAIPIAESHCPINLPGKLLRGGAPPVLVNGEMWSFFHTWSHGHTYEIGLYTFDPQPPFAIKRWCRTTLLGTRDRLEGFPKQVVYPCGALLRDGRWILSMGWNDRECRLEFFDHATLEKMLI